MFTSVLTAKSILLFLAAGLFEIDGGYMVWLWRRNGKAFLPGGWRLDPLPLWSRPDISARPIREGLCGI